MAAPIYSADDYAGAMLALLPRGRAWPKRGDSVLARTVGTLAPAYARNHARANALLVDAFPATCSGLLPEWEASLGLPDPCSGPAATTDARRAEVAAKLAQRGGQSVAYYTAVARRLGYDVRIEMFAPARAGMLRAGQPVLGAAWAHTWRIVAPAQTVRRFRAGAGKAGEPLAVWGNASLECTLGRIKPAHTILQFAYGG